MRLLPLLLLFSLMARAQWPLPAIPDTLRTPQRRAAFLARHYWEQADTARLEEGFATFAALLRIIPDTARREPLRALMGGLNAEVLYRVDDLAQKYLAETLSPQRSDTLYIRYLQARTLTPMDEAGRQRAAFLLKDFTKALPGTPAPDLRLDGTTLYNVLRPHTLLLFYSPTCEDCRRTIDTLRRDTSLHVVAIYGGVDRRAYRRHRRSMPALWRVFYCPEAPSRYYIPHTPTLYVIDDGHVTSRE